MNLGHNNLGDGAKILLDQCVWYTGKNPDNGQPTDYIYCIMPNGEKDFDRIAVILQKHGCSTKGFDDYVGGADGIAVESFCDKSSIANLLTTNDITVLEGAASALDKVKTIKSRGMHL
ncbi:MAG: hypothetical protein ABL857_04360 [Rickettsiales bacterium]|jgi:hypothetical protein